jgi:hypothetical protein
MILRIEQMAGFYRKATAANAAFQLIPKVGCLQDFSIKLGPHGL